MVIQKGSIYSLSKQSTVVFSGVGSISKTLFFFIGHSSFYWPCTFLRLWGMSIYWINTSSKKAVLYKDCAAWNQVWVILTSLLEACSLIGEVCLLFQANFGVIHVFKLDCVQTKNLDHVLYLTLYFFKWWGMSKDCTMTCTSPWGVEHVF